MRISVLNNIIVITLFLSFIGNKSYACDDFAAFKHLMEGPPRSRYEYRGRYVNWAYEYSVKIPQGHTGYDGRDEANHSGFGLALGKSSQSYIFVIGEHNSLEYTTPREAATQAVESLRQGGKDIESQTITESHLGTLNAVLLEVIYNCPGSSDRHVQSSVMALSPDNRFLYTLELDTPTSRYKSDHTVLDEIVKSWKMISESRRRGRR
jgi:hypothetical protein